MTANSLAAAWEHIRAGRLRQAEAALWAILFQNPNETDALEALALCVYQAGRGLDAVTLLEQAVAIQPGSAKLRLNLGVMLDGVGRIDDAISAYQRAIEMQPDYAVAHSNLGDALRRKGNARDAAQVCRQALKLNPQLPEAQRNLGVALLDSGEWRQSIPVFDLALKFRPAWAEVHRYRAESLLYLGEYEASVDGLKRALEFEPGSSAALNSLGNADAKTGQLDLALRAFQEARQRDAGNVTAASNRLFILQFHPGYDAAAILAEHQDWDRQYARPLPLAAKPHQNDRSPQRRLRIGYVSTDFYGHCQTLFTMGLLTAHDRAGFEIFCYADVTRPDLATETLKSRADQWRWTMGVKDAELAQQIRADNIDILVDLGMHMGNGRPLLFASKAAPVQVAWLAYPGTTGMSAMDYRLTDPYLDPPSSDGNYTEQSIRLPDTFLCYDATAIPPAGDLQAGPLPHEGNSYITFGCLNNFCKVNEGVLELWGRVLNQLPTSRLRLLCPPSRQQWTIDQFARRGVAAQRVDFAPFQSRDLYLAEYQRIDIGLDTLPYNGHTTSLDSYWMGVPVVTRIGATVAGRAGWSQLSNLKLTELAARDDDDFVKIAIDLAGDLPRLAELRRLLRKRMLESPLTDFTRFARNMEAAYRQMWTRYCHG